MKQYYLSPIVGSGTRANPYRAKLSGTAGASYAAVIPSDPSTGAPKFAWALCIVEAPDHTQLRADAALGPLPVFSPDSRLNGMPAADRVALESVLVRFLGAMTLLNGNPIYREVVRGIGQVLEATFVETSLDVS